MKATITILVCVLAGGLVWAQSPSIIQNTRNTMNAVGQSQAAGSNAALNLIENAAPAASVAPKQVSGGASPQSPMSPRPAHHAKSSRGSAIHEDATAAKPPLVEPKTTAPLPGTTATGENGQDSEDAASGKNYNATNKRDPFLSPVVSRAGGSGCSTGKKCLEIGTISLRGVVRSDSGFIALVSNSLNKAYFLRENDPVFNGYVVKITEDSIVFQETLQDRLGKTFTREVVKKITAPAV